MTNRITLFCTTGEPDKILALAHRDYGFASALMKADCCSDFTRNTIVRTVLILRHANQPYGTWGSVLQMISSEN